MRFRFKEVSSDSVPGTATIRLLQRKIDLMIDDKSEGRKPPDQSEVSRVARAPKPDSQLGDLLSGPARRIGGASVLSER